MIKLYKGWRITFRQNIHMYCHELIASKGDVECDIPCEDTPDGFVGIWLYDLDAEGAIPEDLLIALREWANTTDLNYRLYITKDEFEQND